MISSSPKVSIVCAWYNRSDYIKETIESLLAQDYLNFEIVIVNDGSTDPRVREELEKFDDTRLHVHHCENVGFTRAIRTAIDSTSSEYIGIQGAGDYSYPNRISRQVGFLEKRPNFAVAGCRYVNRVKGGKGDGKATPSKHATLTPAASDVLKGNPFSHGEVLIRRSAYEEVGGYRTIFENSQDKDLWLRLTENWNLGVIDAFLYERRFFSNDGISSNLSKSLTQVAYAHLADYSYIEKKKRRKDPVEQYGILAVRCMPSGLALTLKILRVVRQVSRFGRLSFKDLFLIKKFFGYFNFSTAVAFYLLNRISRLIRNVAE